MELLELLKHPEGKSLEFKRDLSSPGPFLRAVVALANTSGGTIVIGVADGGRQVRAVELPLDAEEAAANMISDAIAPRLLPELELVTLGSATVVVVRIHPSPHRPHYIKKQGVEGGTYVRVGSTNRLADPPLIEEMRRYARGTAFDEQPVVEASLDDLDFDYARRLLPDRLKEPRDLESARLAVPYQGALVPTVGGMLLTGRDRLRKFPDAWIQVGRFGGVERVDILDHRELTGPLLESLEEAVEFVQKHSRRAASITGLRRRDVWNLPPVAVREALLNAVLHADYSQQGAPIRVAIFDDRLEVDSPGLLPFGMTVESLQEGVSRVRNRVLGRVMHELGLVERWGSGVRRMMAASQDAGLPPPQWKEIGFSVRVTIFSEPESGPSLDPTGEQILLVLDAGDGLSTRRIAEEIGLTTRATRTRLARLTDLGLIRDVGTSATDPNRKYYRVRTDSTK